MNVNNFARGGTAIGFFFMPNNVPTVALHQGKNSPREKRPRSGPPIIPKMLSAACMEKK